MKYSEFEKLMENAGYKVRDNGLDITVLMSDDSVVSYVAKDTIGVVDLDWLDYAELPIEARKFIADNCMELTFTDLEDREEEEKYYYKLKGFMEKYLNVFEHAEGVQHILDSVKEAALLGNSFKTQFTDKEFEALPDDIKSHNWEKIKVEREE